MNSTSRVNTQQPRFELVPIPHKSAELMKTIIATSATFEISLLQRLGFNHLEGLRRWQDDSVEK